MNQNEGLKKLSREERVAFCREVMDTLSDLVDGEAPADFCERVDEILGDCQTFEAVRGTLISTIELAAEAGRTGLSEPQIDDEAFADCVEKVRARLRE